MSPQEQWETLKDLGPIGSLMAALISVLNLFVVGWWKKQQSDTDARCQTQQTRHDTVVKDLYERIRQEGLSQDAKRAEAVSAMREYTDDERHNLREWIQAQMLMLESRVHQVENDNRDCEKDRRKLEIIARGLRE